MQPVPSRKHSMDHLCCGAIRAFGIAPETLRKGSVIKQAIGFLLEESVAGQETHQAIKRTLVSASRLSERRDRFWRTRFNLIGDAEFRDSTNRATERRAKNNLS